MGITPTTTKSQSKGKTAAQIDVMRFKWLQGLPSSVDTDGAWLDRWNDLTWNVAGNARQFMEWAQYEPDQWQPPKWFEGERLARVVLWLRSVPRTEYASRREDALQILLKTWQDHVSHMESPDLIWDTIHSFYTPEELGEFAPLSVPLPYLPHWKVPEDATPERIYAAKTAEQFCLYSGLVTWLNTRIGLKILDLESNPF